MRTERIKEIGKWMMIVGGTIFTAGAGGYSVANYIESREHRKIHEVELHKIDEEEALKQHKLKEEAITAAKEKDRLYTEKIKNMDSKAFARFHAENVAKADAVVREEAENVKKASEAEIVKVRLECKEEINKIREECLKKIEEADKKRDDAVAKYEAIDTLFTNKDKVLSAKKALDKAVKKNKEAKDNQEELLKSIKDFLED
nr:hypothetical protein [uncultured Mediterraneibacter sp.]